MRTLLAHLEKSVKNDWTIHDAFRVFPRIHPPLMKLITLVAIVGTLALVNSKGQDIGKPAPAFTAENLRGEKISLKQLGGKIVVLEWVNFSCPFVKKHHSGGNLPKLQTGYQAKDVVCVSINSGAKGKQGYHEPDAMAKIAEAEGSKAAHFVMDPTGEIGKAYAAKFTPHLFIINKEGVLVYDGAIDSKASTDVADVESAEKFFVAALEATLAGGEVKNAKNKPYGCGVKY